MLLTSVLIHLSFLFSLITAYPLTKRYTAVKIVSARSGLCITANPGRYGLMNGVSVVSRECQYAPITWEINRGSGSITLTPNPGLWALDAGSNPGNNGLLKIWTSYPGLYQQTWYYTDDNRIAITGGNQCLDEGDNGIQTYQCTTGNTNQIFYIQEEPLPPATATPILPTLSTSVSSPASTKGTAEAGGTIGTITRTSQSGAETPGDTRLG